MSSLSYSTILRAYIHFEARSLSGARHLGNRTARRASLRLEDTRCVLETGGKPGANCQRSKPEDSVRGQAHTRSGCAEDRIAVQVTTVNAANTMHPIPSPTLKTRDATQHDASGVTVQIRAHTDAPSLLNTTREHPLSFSAPPTILRALAFVLTADDAVPDALRVAVAAPRAAAQVPPQKPHRVGRGPPRRTFFFAVSLPQFCILPAA